MLEGLQVENHEDEVLQPNLEYIYSIEILC